MKNQSNLEPTRVLWKTDDELFQIVRNELYSAVIGDIMDKLGLVHQFLSPRIQPLRDDMFIVGRAMTVLEADVVSDKSSNNPVLNKPFGLMLEALDDLKKNEVYVCTGASPTYALWGELMATRAQMLGAAGAVVDGYSRDTKGILSINFPSFSYGRYAQDQAPRGKVIDFRVPVEMNGVRINPGDIIIGDIDGVCVVPKVAEEEVFRRAIEKARGEKMVQKKIQEGMSAKEAFDKYGIM
jgi:regulator of RNase E activity RraA